MAMVNTMLNLSSAVKDSRWLTLEVCREYQRNKCSRTENECKFAHPPPHVEVQNGRVTACFDSIKGKCQRKDPPCKYLHPPQHLREQLLQNGRNNLILRNLQMQAAQQAALQPLMPIQTMYETASSNKPTVTAYPTLVPGQYPIVAHPYLGSIPTSVAFNPYATINQGNVQTVAVPGGGDATMVTSPLQGVIQAIPSQQKLASSRPDRLEVCREYQRGTCTRQPSECRYAHPPDNVTVDTAENQVTVCMDFVKGKCTRDSCKYFHPPAHLQALIKATQQRSNTTAAQAQALPQVVEVIPGKKRPRDHADDLVLQGALPGVIPYKRVAVADGKSGLPMYHPGANFAYQQALTAMQLQQQYVPATSYTNKSGIPVPTQISQSSPLPQTMQIPQQHLVPVTPVPLVVSPEAAASTAMVTAPIGVPSNNAYTVNYFDSNQQLLDTLPVCRDFKLGRCNRPECKSVHIMEDYVEVKDGRAAVCRDAVRGKCTRAMCKYYHIPIPLPPSK
ncbi:muscleblind-like protein 1 isoform X5 [Pecten maximus]|uniref:muscleblind-like protein 1 isoform X5 n=1 Tax=Pecten maximus TaxID=6579 RepID=UPI0014582DB1|nr:muscleblind-like protein 1 isoform X5 [Pecten maximus]